MEVKSILQIRKQLEYILGLFTNHPALYRMFLPWLNLSLPVVYMHESYKIGQNLWYELFDKRGTYTVRGTIADAVYLGMIDSERHLADHIKAAKFDGFYNYFPNNRRSWASSWANWDVLTTFAQTHDLIFIPSISPGYLDLRVIILKVKSSSLINKFIYFHPLRNKK